MADVTLAAFFREGAADAGESLFVQAVKGMRDGIFANIVAARSCTPAPQSDSDDGQDSSGKPEQATTEKPTGDAGETDRPRRGKHQRAATNDLCCQQPRNAKSMRRFHLRLLSSAAG
jgi:hypothetical protein